MLTVTIFAANKDTPITYTGCVRCVGEFEASENYPLEDVEKLVEVNGGSILYTSIREMVLMLTSRGPWQPLMLPSVSFSAMHGVANSSEAVGEESIDPGGSK